MGTNLAIIDKKLSASFAESLTAERIEMVRENMDGDSLRIFDLTRLTAPSGNSAAVWNCPWLDSPAKHIDGVILGVRYGRSYWSSDEINNTPPNCSSEEGVFGNGTPGGECAKCQFNVFGSAKKGKGKACKEVENLIVSVPGQTLPIVVKVPSASLTSWKRYKLGLASSGTSFKRIVTRFALKHIAGNPSYFQVTCEAVGMLDPATHGLMTVMGSLIGESLGTTNALPAPTQHSALPPAESNGDSVSNSGDPIPF